MNNLLARTTARLAEVMGSATCYDETGEDE